MRHTSIHHDHFSDDTRPDGHGHEAHDGGAGRAFAGGFGPGRRGGGPQGGRGYGGFADGSTDEAGRPGRHSGFGGRRAGYERRGGGPQGGPGFGGPREGFDTRGFDDDRRAENERHHRHDERRDGGRVGRGFGGGRGGFGGPFDGFAEEFGPGFGRGRGRGGRGPGRGRRGDVRAAILALLSDEPMNGYGLISAIAEKSEGLWKPGAGSVYPALGLLEDEGLISPDVEGRKKVYSLTEEGRTYVSEHADEISAPWERVAAPHSGMLDLRPEMHHLAMALHQVTATGDAEQIAAARSILEKARKDVYRLLAGDLPGEQQ